MAHTVFITGAAGYVGGMLVEQFSARPDVVRIIGLDKESMPEDLCGNEKLIYLEYNTADEGWEEIVQKYQPDIVIHTAWQIRELYGDREREWKWNVDGSDRVFDFAFEQPSVKRLIYFSTVSSYGAFSSNTTDHFFTENEPFRKTDYLYAEEKRAAEEHLEERYKKARGTGSVPRVFILRPAAITGPRGRFARIRFGLQSALSGSLKGRGSTLYNFVSLLVSWVPVTPSWLRQYVHEDDVSDIVALLSFGDVKGDYEAFNLAPPGRAVFGADMARAVGKRTLPTPPWVVRFAFFVMWNMTRGRIPTGRGSWKGYSYPIAVDGSKLSREYGYHYRSQSFDAFYATNGRYESVVPEELRRRA